MSGNSTRSSLNVLGTLHLVAAGFGLLMMLMLAVHWLMFNTMMRMDFPHRPDEPDPQKVFEEMRGVFVWFYLVMGGLSLLSTLSSLLTGLGILKRRWHGLCVAGSAISCLWIPLGTALGVWSLLVLLGEEGQAEFGIGGTSAVDDRDFV